MKALVAYFSAEGNTARVAQELAESIGAELFEIRPREPYTAADIKWTNPMARCNREKLGKKDVPVADTVPDFEEYGLVFLGFPIWYGAAPNVVNTFCKGYDWTGKRVAAFATSGGSGIGKTAEKLRPYVQGGTVADAKLCRSAAELTEWARALCEKA